MLVRAWFTTAVVLLATVAARAAPESVLESLESEIRRLADRTSPAVVRVESKCRRMLRVVTGMGQSVSSTPTFTECSVGSGFVVGPDRKILTSSSVVEGAIAVRVTFSNGKTASAKVIGGDAFFRVAVLEAAVPEDIRPLELSDRRSRAGSFALHCGKAPYAGPRLALGLICSTHRSHLGYDNFLVVSVPLTPGDSGAPFIGSDGRVLGMGSATLSELTRSVQSKGAPGGMIFRSSVKAEAGRLACCVPASDLRHVLDDVVEHGRVQKAWLGVTLQPDEPRVTGVVDASPAQVVGIVPGDVIRSLEGHPIGSRMDLIGRLVRLRPGTVVTLLVERDGSEIEVRVPLALRPEKDPADLLLVAEGVEVIRVPPCCRATPLLVGDIITSINGERARDTASVRKILSSVNEETKLDIVVLRNGWKVALTNK